MTRLPDRPRVFEGVQDATVIPCATCGYDLRAQPPDGLCPECGGGVAEAIRLAAIPIRPAWADSDPRWRRRMLAGTWILTLVPLVEVLQLFELTTVPIVPVFYEPQVSLETLRETLFVRMFPYLAFCIGVVLFFSKERFRQPSRLDWTRRWGVLGSYGVLLLGIPTFAFIGSLVMLGIGAMFQSIPLAYQPAATPLFVRLGTGYVYYGPIDSDLLYVALTLCSAATVLLACVPLYDALRCGGPRWLARMILALLSLVCLLHVSEAAGYFLKLSSGRAEELPIFFLRTYFFPIYPAVFKAAFTGGIGGFRLYAQEAITWLLFMTIALWLSAAQLRVWRRRSKPNRPADV